MGYNGYLIKVIGTLEHQTDYAIPLNYMLEKTYDMTYSVMDYDSTRNGAGRLVRNALLHRVPHCSVTIKPLYDTDLNSLFSNISERYTIAKEKKVVLSVFIPEINDYVLEEFYMPDTNPKIRRIFSNGKIKYESFTLEFIGY